jgi:hypothetical protein
MTADDIEMLLEENKRSEALRKSTDYDFAKPITTIRNNESLTPSREFNESPAADCLAKSYREITDCLDPL